MTRGFLACSGGRSNEAVGPYERYASWNTWSLWRRLTARAAGIDVEPIERALRLGLTKQQAQRIVARLQSQSTVALAAKRADQLMNVQAQIRTSATTGERLAAMRRIEAMLASGQLGGSVAFGGRHLSLSRTSS
jgi:hypothetical protein